jgi:hypothetical protein
MGMEYKDTASQVRRRARDSNPQGLAPAGFQDQCNSRSASSPVRANVIANIRNRGSEFNERKTCGSYPAALWDGTNRLLSIQLC